MINIDIKSANGVVTPSIKIGIDHKYEVANLAYILYLLETGAYAPKFKDLLIRQLDTDSMNNVNSMVATLNSMRSISIMKSDMKSKIDRALVPMVPNLVSVTKKGKKIQ